MRAGSRYPVARPRAVAAAPAVAEKFERYESLEGSSTNDWALLGEFSGRPDTIRITALDADVDVKLADRVGREESPITIPAETTVQLHIGRERVYIRNVDADVSAAVTAVGQWAEPREAS